MKILVHIIRGQALCNEVVLQPTQRRSRHQLSTFATSPSESLLNILIADDNELCRKAIFRQLEKFTTHVTACEDGAQALEAYKKASQPYQFVFTDYQMPQMNGLELIAAIRAYEGTKDNTLQAKIIRKESYKNYIVLTGDDDAEVEEQAKRNGVNSICKLSYWKLIIVKKPIKSEDLNKIISQWPANLASVLEKNEFFLV